MVTVDWELLNVESYHFVRVRVQLVSSLLDSKEVTLS